MLKRILAPPIPSLFATLRLLITQNIVYYPISLKGDFFKDIYKREKVARSGIQKHDLRGDGAQNDQFLRRFGEVMTLVGLV